MEQIYFGFFVFILVFYLVVRFFWFIFVVLPVRLGRVASLSPALFSPCSQSLFSALRPQLSPAFAPAVLLSLLFLVRALPASVSAFRAALAPRIAVVSPGGFAPLFFLPFSFFLPMSLASLLSAPVVGFSGSRSCPAAVSAVLALFPLVPASTAVFVGCASGVDLAARAAFPDARVFRASQFPGPFAAALVARSAALVRSVAKSGGILVCAPEAGQVCPASVSPAPSWCSGGGSGSWASAALACGIGCPVLLFVASGAPVPLWASRRASGTFPAPGGAWLYLPAAAVPAPALSLF